MANDRPDQGSGITTLDPEDGPSNNSSDNIDLEKTYGIRRIGKFTLRGKTDDLPQSWWFASTAVPLLAATIGPMANVLSIAALVTNWRMTLPNNGQLPEGTDDNGIGIPDPHWVVILNGLSLACGFVGNFFLLANFTRRIRYIVALPMSIIFWYLATGLLIGITAAMNIYTPPHRPGETYSQGFWYAIIAAILYMVLSMLLMINMLGYLLGHYPQHFELDDDQRTLILQTMMFFLWLAGGAAVFAKVCGWSYVDSLYFCDVTVLTVGFGDFAAPNDTGRGIVFPYSVGGIIFLGLMINSIRKFAASMSHDKVIKAHQQHVRERTINRTVTSEKELRERLHLPQRRPSELRRLSERARSRSSGRNEPERPPLIGAARRRITLDENIGKLDVVGKEVIFQKNKAAAGEASRDTADEDVDGSNEDTNSNRLGRFGLWNRGAGSRADHQRRLLLLQEEKDRFEAMRDIQHKTKTFRKYLNLSMSIISFSLLWCLGALGFMYAEHRIQGLTYFQALYFCYVSLLTIGYGDLSPRSNAGKPLFVVWSLVAVPTMTILVSDLGDTVVASFNRGTFTLADWTVLPKVGVVHDFLEKHPWLRRTIQEVLQRLGERRRIKHGFDVQDPDDPELEDAGNPLGTSEKPLTLNHLADTEELTDHGLARRLAMAIKRIANDLHADPPKRYNYEEWVEFTRLIRFSRLTEEEVEEEEEEEGLIEWDWIGEDSPMLSDETESQWILDRLCESLNRYTRKQAIQAKRGRSRSPKPSAFRESRELRNTGRHRYGDSLGVADASGQSSGDLSEIRAWHERARHHEEAIAEE